MNTSKIDLPVFISTPRWPESHPSFNEGRPDTPSDIVAASTATAPYLHRLQQRFGDDLSRILEGRGEEIFTQAVTIFRERLEKTTQDEEVMAAIRRFRGRINHLVAMSDIFEISPLPEQISWLSRCAGIAVESVARWLCGPGPEGDVAHQGWFILGMGKLGAGELNFSSDIDIIIITLSSEDDNANSNYVRRARRLTSLLSTPTADGIGWRVDLRLRPDPGATPIAIPRDAAISYYESLARTWERAAFIRARPIAGNLSAGEDFLKSIQPFIWRRHLDYTVLEDMRVMLRRDARDNHLLGFNIKTGIGGIRGIEFFVHVHQLIVGGREPALREKETTKALFRLGDGNWITRQEATRLSEAYYIWRRLEHRLQMIGDAQTHQLPKSEEAFQAIASFCGHDTSGTFRDAVIRLSDQVVADTAPLIRAIGDDEKEDQDPFQNWLYGNTESRDDAATHLTSLGYQDPASLFAVCEGWMAGRAPATRSDQSREKLRRILPRLIHRFAETDNPDQGFSSFAVLVDQLPAGLQLFSLLESNDALATTLGAIVTGAPSLREQLIRHPMVVDRLMYEDFWDTNISWETRRAELDAALKEARDYQDVLDILRRVQRDWSFQVGVQLMHQVLDPVAAGKAFSTIAGISIQAILPVVHRQMTERYGDIEDGSMVVLALGRLGAEEMTILSDLDLICIYDCAENATSSGPRSLSASQWFTRFVQQLINGLTSPTAEGRCYNVDMRLRPSGNAGPVAVHIDGFRQYQMEEAWLWEHFALLKARVVGNIGATELSRDVEDVISTALLKPRKSDEIRAEVISMRERIRKAMPAKSARDLRHREGGLLDLDFLIQMLQLMPSSDENVFFRSARLAVPELARKELLDEEQAGFLAKAVDRLTALHQWIRLILPENRSRPKSDIALPETLATLSGHADYDALDTEIDDICGRISAILEQHLVPDNPKENQR